MDRLIAVILCSTFAFAQAAPPAQKPAPPVMNAPAVQGAKPAAPAKAELSPTAAVITIEGLCNGKLPATPSPDCKTIITRAQFEKLMDALDPNMPPPRRQQLAEVYSRMLAFSDAAEQRGIPNTPDAQEVLRFARMQTLAQLLVRDLQREASKVPPAETEKYYNEHQQQYEQGSFLRIFVPKTPPGGAEKPPDEKTIQAEADKIHAAAVAGGDFEKLQKQAYDDLGIKTPPPPTNVGTQRREALPANQQKVFDLQPGKVSELLNEPGGFYIFKLESKKKLTLADVTPEINRTIEGERMKSLMDKLTNNVKPVLNEEYFGPSAPPVAPPAGGLPPGHPGAASPRPGQSPARPAPPPPAPAKPPAQ